MRYREKQRCARQSEAGDGWARQPNNPCRIVMNDVGWSCRGLCTYLRAASALFKAPPGRSAWVIARTTSMDLWHVCASGCG